MEPWRTAIVDAGPTHIHVRGHDVLDLMQRSTFTDLIFLLHHERLPSDAERRFDRCAPDRFMITAPGRRGAARLAASGIAKWCPPGAPASSMATNTAALARRMDRRRGLIGRTRSLSLDARARQLVGETIAA
jgi:citrate synthase